VRNLLYSVKGSDVVKSVDAWRETSMEAENLVVNECSKGEVVEEVGKVLPDVCVAVFSEALIVKAIDLGDLAGFMITTEDRDSLGVSNFKSNKEGNSFDRVVSSVNIIAHEEVVCIWIRAADSE